MPYLVSCNLNKFNSLNTSTGLVLTSRLGGWVRFMMRETDEAPQRITENNLIIEYTKTTGPLKIIISGVNKFSIIFWIQSIRETLCFIAAIFYMYKSYVELSFTKRSSAYIA